MTNMGKDFLQRAADRLHIRNRSDAFACGALFGMIAMTIWIAGAIILAK